MLFKNHNNKNAWQVVIPEKYGVAPYFIHTSPVVLGSSMECDIIIQDSSLCESHIQFVLVKDGRFIEIYDLSVNSSDGVNKKRTLLDGAAVDGKIKLKAKKDKSFVLKAGDVHLSLVYGAVLNIKMPVKQQYIIRDKDIDWFYRHEGVEYGPVKFSEILKAVRESKILPLDDAWHSGITNRIKAFEIPDLFAEKSHIPELSDTTDYEKYVCPYCWNRYKPENLLYISRHPELMGDTILGDDEQERFLPRHIKPIRRALDSKGEICTDMACPRCHLRIPTPFLDSQPLFFSIIGTPGSGKSYYLATSTWRLRTILPKYFGLNFEDIDLMTNLWINGYEEKLFLPARGVDYNSIEKTQIESGHTVTQVKINSVDVTLPLPAMFTLLSNNRYYKNESVQNTIAFYDNAGELFQTGQDVIQKPGSLHILRADGLIFLFDPTADPRFTNIINSSLRETVTQTVYQQQKILIEVIDRLRKHTGLNVKDRFTKPIVIGVSKADLLMDYFKEQGLSFKELPYKLVRNSSNEKHITEVGVINIFQIKQISAYIREMFLKIIPEFVNTIESFADNVIYIPVSAIGYQPDSKGVHPSDIKPLWVEIPFLYMLSHLGYIPYINQ